MGLPGQLAAAEVGLPGQQAAGGLLEAALVPLFLLVMPEAASLALDLPPSSAAPGLFLERLMPGRWALSSWPSFLSRWRLAS